MAKRYVSRGAIVLALVSALLGAVFATSAATALVYEGGGFPEITSSAGPEEFTWEVELKEGQELVSIDEKHAAVYYDGGHIAFSIEATLARDAIGTSVPTSLAVSEGNLITLTVHHRAGNPKAGGAPFDYPIVSGSGWEGGVVSIEVKGPKDEAELRREAEERAAHVHSIAPIPRQFHVQCATKRGAVARMHPTRCLVSEPHGSALLAGLDWRGWQSRVARADGFLVDSATDSRQAVRVALSGTVTCDHIRYYKRLRLKPDTGPPRVFAISPC